MEIGLPDGSTAKISSLPDFATEATQKQMLAIARQLAKNNDKAKAAMENLVTHAANGSKEDKKANEEQKKAIKDLGKEIQGGLTGFRTRFADRIEADTQQVFGFAAQALGGIGAAAIGAAGFLVGLTKAAAGFAENVGRQMDAVVQAGAGFNDQFGGSLSGAMSSLRGIGLTTEQAAGLMAEFSRMTQIVTKARLPQMTRSFLAATNNGRDLGLTLADATRAMADEVQLRSELMDVSTMDSRTLGLSAARQIAMQNRYAAALGMSVEQLRKSSAEQVKNNNFVLLAQLKYGPQFTDAMRAFSTTVKGQAGEAFDPVSDALMTMISDPAAAATEQGQAISRFASSMQAAGVPMMDVIQRAKEQLQQTGRIDGEAFGNEIIGLMRQAAVPGSQAAQLLMNQMIGDTNPLIAAFAQSIVNLQTSANRMQRNLKADAGKSALDRMRDTVNALTATFDEMKINLFSALSPILTELMTGLIHLAGPLTTAFTNIVRALLGGADGKPISEAMKELGPNIIKASESIARFIENVKKTFAQFTDTKGNIDWGGLIGNLIAQAAISAISLIKDIFVEGIRYIWENPEVIGALVAGIGVLMGIAAAKAAGGALIGGLTDRLRDNVSGRAGGAGAGGQARDARGRFAKAPPTTMKSVGLDALKGLSGALTWVAKGAAIAASMFLIGKALPVLADGLKSFADVEWESMAQVGATLVTLGGGLSLLGKVPLTVIGKGFVGAAAISAAMVMIGFGLSQVVGPLERFQQINWETMGKAAAALVGLGVIGAVAGAFAAPLLVGAAAIGALGLALQLFPTDVLESLGGIIESVGTSIATVVGAMGDSIGKIVDRISSLKTAGIDATTNQIERLSAIPSDRIQATANAINQMKEALDGFGGGFFSNLGDAITGNPVLELLSEFTFDPNPILSAANATNRLTASLTKFSEIDVSKINEVNSSIVGMARASNATVASMEKVAKLDGKVIAENARAIMIYNGAAQGEIIVPPTPAAGADLSSFYQSIVRALNGGTPVSQASLNPSRESGTQPETLQQQMVRLLNTINTGIDRQNSTLRELSEKLRT